jgi:hypothetical protein
MGYAKDSESHCCRSLGMCSLDGCWSAARESRPEQTEMRTIALIDIRLTIRGESIGTVVSTLETIQAVFKANEVVKNLSTR